MRRLFFSLLVLMVAPGLFASWKKPYFGATPPGSWATYRDTTPDMKMTTTMSRLADDDGSARVELNMKFANDQYPPVRNEYTLDKDFPLDRKLIDYMNHINSGAVVAGDTEPTVLEAASIEAIRKNAPQYEPTAKFKGTETLEGRKTDHYTYTVRYPSPHETVPATTESGDLWFSDEVPFGLVKQTSVTKDDKGNVTMKYERVLLDSGTKKEK